MEHSQLLKSDLGNFDERLPDFAQGSWENASTIVMRDGVRAHQTSADHYIVESLTSPDQVYSVDVQNRRCGCERGKTVDICAHLLATLYACGLLEMFISTYKPPSLDQQVSVPSSSGRKPGTAKFHHHNMSNWTGRHSAQHSFQHHSHHQRRGKR